MLLSKKNLNIFLLILILGFLTLFVYTQFFVLRPLEKKFDEGSQEIADLIQGREEDRAELLDEIDLYRKGLYALNLLLEARKQVISGRDEENPFLVFDYSTVLDDLRRLLPKDATATSFQVDDKGLLTLPVESSSYKSLGRTLRSFKDARLFEEVQIPSGVQMNPVEYTDAFGNRGFKKVYSFVIQAKLNPIFWQDPLPFKDVSNHDYFAQAIRDLEDKRSIEGYSDKLFRPHQPINRAEFYKLALHAMYDSGAITLGEYTEVSDAPETIWYSKYLKMADRVGISFEVDENDPLHLERTISRMEALKAVMKIYEEQINEMKPNNKGGTKDEKKSKRPIIVPFRDIGPKSEYYELVQKAYRLKMLHEKSFFKFFEPRKPVTRAEVAYWVHTLKFLHLSNNK